MRLAENSGLPVLSFIRDTPRRLPRASAPGNAMSPNTHRRLGQPPRDGHAAHAHDLPSSIGEGGSGGAARHPRRDRPRAHLRKTAYYSVISPEGCAAILWKDRANAAAKAAEALKLNADTLEKLGIVDEIITEPFGGAHNNPNQTAATLKYALPYLNDLIALSQTFARNPL